MTEWNRKIEPYRVTWYAQAGTKLHGWSSRSEFFANVDDAKEAMKRLFPRGVTEACIDVVEDTHNGFGWRSVDRRKRKKIA